MIESGMSFEFSPGSEKHRETLVLADDLRGVVNAAFTNLAGLGVAKPMAADVVIGSVLDIVFESMEKVGVKTDDECMSWCREQFDLFKEGCDEQD
jgi:hypothetical protein